MPDSIPAAGDSLIIDMVRRFAQDRLAPHAAEREKAARIEPEIIAELVRPALYDIAEAKAAEGAPVAPGFYAWWSIRGAIPGVPAPAHPSEAFDLLYIGIAPKDAASSGRDGDATTSPGMSRKTATASSLWKWPPKPFW